MLPPISLARLISPEATTRAGPLIKGWARRTVHRKRSTYRQLKALVNYLPTADEVTYHALGGKAALDWAHKALDENPEEPFNTDVGIQVLGLPYGGPNGGKDNEGQFFSPNTEFFDGALDSPPVMYTHGTQNGFEPEPVGKVTGRWYDRKGGWFNVELDPLSPRYEQLLEAHQTGNLRASTGAVPASYSTDAATGHIDTWLVGELSLVDVRAGYRPVNAYAITKAETERPTLFDDYYGEPVVKDNPTMLQRIQELVNQLMLLLANKEADEDCETDPTAPGFVPPVNKAEEEKCSPDVMDEDMDTAYMKAADFGGKKRSSLDDSDFVFPDERKFPIVDQEDLTSALRLWSQYEGKHSREEFEVGVRRLAKKHKLTLPDSFSKAEDTMPDTQTEEKCESCDEAKRLADTLRAELAAVPETVVAKCARCPEAVNWVRSMVKAGKMPATEAFQHLDTFVESDTTFDAVKAEVEARTIVPAKAEGLRIAGGARSTGDDSIDPEFMNKQRRLAGLAEK